MFDYCTLCTCKLGINRVGYEQDSERRILDEESGSTGAEFAGPTSGWIYCWLGRSRDRFLNPTGLRIGIHPPSGHLYVESLCSTWMIYESIVHIKVNSAV